MRVFRRESEDLAMLVMRFSVGSMFMWFGMDKWSNPEAWFGWLPAWFGIVPVSAATLVVIGGLLEFLLGVAVVASWHLRLFTLMAAGGLLVGNLVMGVSDMTIRDGAVTGVLLSLFIHANAASKRPWNTEVVASICSAYVLLLLVAGVLFLKAGA
jgi:hypothetical protein